jgi:hypothetical protein
MEGVSVMNPGTKVERRCAVCGSKALGRECSECGSPVVPRTDIGILAGVNNNFGTVNNVYNIGAPSQDPEVVDLRDIQDGLNDRFPERIPAPPNVPYFPRSVAPRQLGDGSITRKVNIAAYVFGAVAIVSVIAVIAAFLWA